MKTITLRTMAAFGMAPSRWDCPHHRSRGWPQRLDVARLGIVRRAATCLPIRRRSILCAGDLPRRERIRIRRRAASLSKLSGEAQAFVSLFPPQSQSCSIRYCSTSIQSKRTRRTAGKSIRRSRWSQPDGRQVGRSTGG
jgi:hypothetical protein